MATTQLSGRRTLTASCERCGSPVELMDEKLEKRLVSMRCECGGRFHRGRYEGKPTPVELYQLLITLLEAERIVFDEYIAHGADSVEASMAKFRCHEAEKKWDKARETMAVGVRLRAELEKTA